ncbi:hypothetical protein AAFF_G00306940 [Aldrovandia affinis]|uniref:Uncharacterized protein n=1 Tax=Aldrovandia affinis TaxID=143900 RepID=A0AAD7W0Q0_9TELE|nr:hypothetical protein AAFF_G00306940 [Aldrovandia affinis]
MLWFLAHCGPRLKYRWRVPAHSFLLLSSLGGAAGKRLDWSKAIAAGAALKAHDWVISAAGGLEFTRTGNASRQGPRTIRPQRVRMRCAGTGGSQGAWGQAEDLTAGAPPRGLSQLYGTDQLKTVHGNVVRFTADVDHKGFVPGL